MRQPIVAGTWYGGSERGCRADLEQVDVAPAALDGLPDRLLAAVVPHAGWGFSGRVAMRVYRTAESRVPPEATFILFGAVHRFGVSRASVYARGGWHTPLGPLMVDEPLAELLLAEAEGLLIADADAHMSEHSIEIQLPMIRYVFGERLVVPIAAPPRSDSHEVGRRVAEICAAAGRQVFVVGTTDLTHYGAFGYGFAPQGDGQAGLEWVKNENDPRMIELMRGLRAEAVVAEAGSRHNACGAGAVAATLAAARELGSRGGHLLEYTTSYDVGREKLYGDTVGDFVGYAGLVF